MANYNFKEDIELGEQGEKVVIKDLERLNGKFINDNKDINYDLIMNMPSGEVSYEIKTDVYCFPDNDTGNIFIEYECRGKSSGINATKANFFGCLNIANPSIAPVNADKPIINNHIQNVLKPDLKVLAIPAAYFIPIGTCCFIIKSSVNNFDGGSMSIFV